MKVRLVFVRNCTAQYSNEEYAMEKQCKSVELKSKIEKMADCSNDLRTYEHCDRWELE